MPNDTTRYSLPHHNLIAYRVACDLLVAVINAQIRDRGLRDQALRAAKSACLNIAEANGRSSAAEGGAYSQLPEAKQPKRRRRWKLRRSPGNARANTPPKRNNSAVAS